MKIILPSFASFLFVAMLSATQAVVAQSPAARATVAADPESLVRQMAETLAGDHSISARIRLHVDLFGNQLVGAGIYLQQGLEADRRLRWEVKIPVGQRLATLQQVCDGNYLWQYHDLTDKPALTRVDIHRVQQALEQVDRKALPDPFNQWSLGGLPRLVDSLRQSFAFGHAEEGKLDTLPVWIIHGTWRPEALASISAGFAKQSAAGRPLDLKKLPPQMPEEVLLYVGQDDLFPYRIEYLRRPVRQGRGDKGQPAEAAPILIVELYEVRLNSPIDPQQFVYQPGGAEVLDTTGQVLKSLSGK